MIELNKNKIYRTLSALCAVLSVPRIFRKKTGGDTVILLLNEFYLCNRE